MSKLKVSACVVVLLCLTTSCPPAGERFQIDITNSLSSLSITGLFTVHEVNGITSDNLLNSNLAAGASRNFSVRMSDLGAGNRMAINLGDNQGDVDQILIIIPGGYVEGMLLTIEVNDGPPNGSPEANFSVS